MTVECALCGSTDIRAIARTPDRVGDLRDIFECGRCAALTPVYPEQDHELGTQAQVAFHEDYWSNPDVDTLNQELEALKSVVDEFRPYLGKPGKHNALLEIGVGRGGLLKAMLELGYKAKGCEPSRGLVDIARKYYGLNHTELLNVDARAFLHKIPEKSKFQAIFFWHVLEHLKNPIEILEEFKTLVAEGGHIIFQVPLLLKDYIYPEHYFFFSHRTFSYIGEKIGFSLVDVIYDAENLYVTGVYANRPGPSDAPFMGMRIPPDPMSQIILLRSESRNNHQAISRQQTDVIRSHDSVIGSHRAEIEQRDQMVAALTALSQDDRNAIATLKKLVADSLTTQKAQAAIIDEQTQTMERIIVERNIAIDLLTSRQTLDGHGERSGKVG